MQRALLDGWHNLQPREQQLIKFGLPLIVLLLGYLLLKPLFSQWSGLKTASIQPAINNSAEQIQQPNAAAQELAERFNQLSPKVQARLVRAKELTQQELKALALSAGWQDLTIFQQEATQQETEQTSISGKVANPRQIENLLNQLAKLGWHWQAIDISTQEGAATQVVLSVRPLF